jgi:hypothetical protein
VEQVDPAAMKRWLESLIKTNPQLKLTAKEKRELQKLISKTTIGASMFKLAPGLMSKVDIVQIPVADWNGGVSFQEDGGRYLIGVGPMDLKDPKWVDTAAHELFHAFQRIRAPAGDSRKTDFTDLSLEREATIFGNTVAASLFGSLTSHQHETLEKMTDTQAVAQSYLSGLDAYKSVATGNGDPDWEKAMRNLGFGNKSVQSVKNALKVSVTP